ncbi:MAG: hypothetical protein ACT4PS_18700 [Betaproteobacteria bacterium]
MRKLGIIVALLAAAALGAAWWLKLLSWEHHTGYFGPAFSHDRRHVYAVMRESAGFTWGPGWEHFTPPAHAYLHTDRISLIRIAVADGAVETLETWPASPLPGRALREYRGRIFNTMRASVRPDAAGSVRYEIRIAIPVVPASEIHRLSGTWSAQPHTRRRGEWQRGGHGVAGLSEPVLAGAIEVFALDGPESFPCAVVLLDHARMTARTLAGSSICHGRHPDGPPVQALLEVSRKNDIERVARLERARKEWIAKYMQEGASEGAAMLKSIRALEDTGYLPKSPRLVAHRLTRSEADATTALPLFDIDDAEMASGVFPDIEKALAAPGEEIERSMGRYIAHDHYDNSRRLNAHLAGGAREFLVRYRGTTWRLEIRHAR